MDKKKIIERLQNSMRRAQLFNAAKSETPGAPIHDVVAEMTRKIEEQKSSETEVSFPTPEEQQIFRESLKQIRINNG